MTGSTIVGISDKATAMARFASQFSIAAPGRTILADLRADESPRRGALRVRWRREAGRLAAFARSGVAPIGAPRSR